MYLRICFLVTEKMRQCLEFAPTHPVGRTEGPGRKWDWMKGGSCGGGALHPSSVVD